MIVRPPKKSLSLKGKPHSPFFSKPANNNRPPKRNCLGWICFVAGLLLSMSAFFWIYEKMI